MLMATALVLQCFLICNFFKVPKLFFGLKEHLNRKFFCSVFSQKILTDLKFELSATFRFRDLTFIHEFINLMVKK